jgi:hypothetical protein
MHLLLAYRILTVTIASRVRTTTDKFLVILDPQAALFGTLLGHGGLQCLLRICCVGIGH